MIQPSPVTLLLSRDRPMWRRPDRDRALTRVRPGVYAATAEWAVLAPWQRYLARVHAVALTWSAPVFVLESAAALDRIPLFGEPREIHLLSPNGSTWREGDVAVHGTRQWRRVVEADGMLLTSSVDTTLDLCRVLPPAFALAVGDVALRQLSVLGRTLDLSAAGRAQTNRRGLRQLDWVQERATPLAESVGESVSRAVIEWLGHEPPTLQHEFVHEGCRDRTDFFWLGARTIGESDGYGKYDAADVEASKAHFIAEKKREDRLRRNVGGVIRWDWADTLNWRKLAAKLQAGGLQAVRPQQPALLRTLGSNPRSFAMRSAPDTEQERTE